MEISMYLKYFFLCNSVIINNISLSDSHESIVGIVCINIMRNNLNGRAFNIQIEHKKHNYVSQYVVEIEYKGPISNYIEQNRIYY